ncbi:MAG: hypothetical protein WBW92_05555 [Rhodanobacteraceae bacterium]
MTRSASLILAAVLGGVVVGGIVWVSKPDTVPVPEASQTSSPTQAKPPAPAASSAQAPSASQAPPWADASGVAAAPSSISVASAISTSPRDPEKARQRAAIRARLHKLTANGRHATPAEMSQVLGDLERVEGSPVVAGVDIGALRKNLIAVDKLQNLSRELQAESQKPGGGDKQRIQQILVQLKQIQSEMNYNTTAIPAAAPNN